MVRLLVPNPFLFNLRYKTVKKVGQEIQSGGTSECYMLGLVFGCGWTRLVSDVPTVRLNFRIKRSHKIMQVIKYTMCK